MRGPHPGLPRPEMPGPRMPVPQQGPPRPEGAFPQGPGAGDFGPRGPPPVRGPQSEHGSRPGMGPDSGPRAMGPGGPGPMSGPGQAQGPRPGSVHFPEGEMRPQHGMGPGPHQNQHPQSRVGVCLFVSVTVESCCILPLYAFDQLNIQEATSEEHVSNFSYFEQFEFLLSVGGSTRSTKYDVVAWPHAWPFTRWTSWRISW